MKEKTNLKHIQFAFEFNNNDVDHLQEITKQVRSGFDIIHISEISKPDSTYILTHKIVFSKKIKQN